MDYYSILGISPSADTAEIKKAFRIMLKKYHPDVISHKKTEVEKGLGVTLVDIINAYNILSNPIKRKYYDIQCKHNTIEVKEDVPFQRRQVKTFNYEEFLLKRIHEWQYKVKLFIYDLVFCTGERAVNIYEVLKRKKELSKLEHAIGYYDYFDCLFLIAEYYQTQADIASYNRALSIFYEIGLMEEKRPYFRSYMEEVADRIFAILHHQFENLEINIITPLLKKMEHWHILKKQKRQVVRFNNMMETNSPLTI